MNEVLRIARLKIAQKIYGLYGLKHIVKIRGGVTRRDDDEQVKIELLSRWKL